MPTNILRKAADARRPNPRGDQSATGQRLALLTAGRIAIRIELASTLTADLVWRALPLYSTAETWGACLHLETPVETGRDRTARINAVMGEIYFWVENDRIVVPFGPTPISRKGECRLQAPANVWARALDDPGALSVVTPGEKVSLVQA